MRETIGAGEAQPQSFADADAAAIPPRPQQRLGGVGVAHDEHALLPAADGVPQAAYAACAPNVAARRLLRQLAGEEGSHARRLMGVYYLVTGCCYQPRLQGGRVESLPWREVLRTRYHAETCGGLRYAQAAEATEDVCLREIWEELSAAEYRHARQLLSLLEQMVLA